MFDFICMMNDYNQRYWKSVHRVSKAEFNTSKSQSDAYDAEAIKVAEEICEDWNLEGGKEHLWELDKLKTDALFKYHKNKYGL